MHGNVTRRRIEVPQNGSCSRRSVFSVAVLREQPQSVASSGTTVQCTYSVVRTCCLFEPAVRRNRGKHSSTLTPGVHQTVQSVVAACIPVLGRPATTSTSLGLRLMVLRGSEKTRLGISRAVNAWHRGHVNRNAARSVKSPCQTPAYCHLCRHFYHSKN